MPEAYRKPDAALSRRRRVRAFARRHPLLTGVALLVACMLALRLWWGWHVGRQLAAQRDEMRRRGEPVDPSELKIEPLPDEQNALVLLMRASGQDRRISPAHTALNFPSYPPFGRAFDQAAAASEQANGPVFQLARRARARERSQLQPSFPKPPFNAAFGGLNAARALNNTLVDGSTYRHLKGDDAEAVERLLDSLHVASSLHQDDAVVSQMVAYGVTGSAAYRAQLMAPALRVESPQVRRGTEALIAAFRDEADVARGLRRSFIFGRLLAADVQRWQSAGTWVLRPLAEQDVVRANAAAAAYGSAAEAGSAPEARRRLATAPDEEDPGPPAWSALFPGEKVPRYSRWYGEPRAAYHRYVEQYFRTLGERRATAVSLAVRLYRADHARWPDRLDQLVPAYLPAVPKDPFHDDGRPLGYVVLKGALPDGGDRPLVFFDAGNVVEGAIDSEPMYDWQYDALQRRPRVELRQYRDLARWSPTTRRFDLEQKALREEAERLQREARQQGNQQQGAEQQGRGPASPETVQDDPGEPGAPRDDAKKQDHPED